MHLVGYNYWTNTLCGYMYGMFFSTVVMIISETCRNNKTGIGMSVTCYFDGKYM